MILLIAYSNDLGWDFGYSNEFGWTLAIVMSLA